MANLYDLSIPDNSPTFLYRPSREGEDLNAGWKSFYSNSPDSAYDSTHQSENKAVGTSSHSTTMQGASFELSFKGTAVSLYGSGSAGAYSTTLDNKNAVDGSPGDGLLASYKQLDYGLHTVTLNLTQGRSLNVTSALVKVGMGKTGAAVKQTVVPAVNVNSDGSSSLNSAAFSTSGGGTFNTNHDATGYSRVDTNNAGSSIIFRFSSASALQVYGSVNYDHGTYSATLSPPGGASTGTRIFNATSKWFAYDSVIYWESDLDHSQSYTLTLTNLNEGEYLDVHSVTLMDGQGGSDSSDHNISTGTIVGIAVGIGSLIAIVGILGFLLWRRRRRHRDGLDSATPAIYSGAHQLSKFSPHSEPLLEPFVLPPHITPYTDGTSSTRHSKMDSINSSTSFGASSHAAGPSTHSSTSQSGSQSAYSGPRSEAGSSFLNNNQLPPGAAPSAKGGLPPPTPARTLRQETDAGPVPIQPLSPEEEVLPPGYNPAWSAGQS